MNNFDSSQIGNAGHYFVFSDMPILKLVLMKKKVRNPRQSDQQRTTYKVALEESEEESNSILSSSETREEC